jgi:hypothetical protein
MYKMLVVLLTNQKDYEYNITPHRWNPHLFQNKNLRKKPVNLGNFQLKISSARYASRFTSHMSKISQNF